MTVFFYLHSVRKVSIQGRLNRVGSLKLTAPLVPSQELLFLNQLELETFNSFSNRVLDT